MARTMHSGSLQPLLRRMLCLITVLDVCSGPGLGAARQWGPPLQEQPLQPHWCGLRGGAPSGPEDRKEDEGLPAEHRLPLPFPCPFSFLLHSSLVLFCWNRKEEKGIFKKQNRGLGYILCLLLFQPIWSPNFQKSQCRSWGKCRD